MPRISKKPQKPFDPNAPVDTSRARTDPEYFNALLKARGGTPDPNFTFKKSKVNFNKFMGRDELSRFAPIVKYNPNDVENAVDDSPDSISKRIRVIEKYIHDVSKSIEKIQKFIVDDEKSDRKKTLEELKEKIQLDEKRKLAKKELLLEAGDEPDKQVEEEKPQVEKFQKVKGFLGKLKDAFTTLFVGWLTDKGIQAFRAFQEGNMEKLRSIAKNVAVALAAVGGAMFLFKGGLFKLYKIFHKGIGRAFTRFMIKKFGKIGGQFAKGISKGLKNLGSGAVNLVKNVGKKGLNLVKGVGGKGLDLAKNVGGKGLNIAKNIAGKGVNLTKNIVGKGKNLGKSLLKTGSKNVAKGAVKKGTAKLVAKKIPLVGLVLGTAFAIDRARKGDLLGAGLELISGVASTVPGVGTAISTAADVANIARDVKKSTTGEGEETSKIDSKITTNSTKVNQKNEKIYDYGAPEDEVVVINGSQDQNAGGSQTMGSPDYGEIEEEIFNFESEDESNMYLVGTQSEFNIV